MKKNEPWKVRHGMFGTPVYAVWNSMIGRCRNEKHRAYADYGGRGIKVCDRWKDFAKFYEDMGDPPAGKTLDRKDNDGPYSPENCRWATASEQNRNRRGTVWLTHNGETKHLRQWASELGLSPTTLKERLRAGWPVEDALTRPKRVYTRHE